MPLDLIALCSTVASKVVSEWAAKGLARTRRKQQAESPPAGSGGGSAGTGAVTFGSVTHSGAGDVHQAGRDISVDGGRRSDPGRGGR